MFFDLWLLSKTWHIKRDYDRAINACAILSSMHYLRPDISKGITTFVPREGNAPILRLSTTWHIKRDYDPSFMKKLQSLKFYYLRPDISKGITTFLSAFLMTSPLNYLRPDISKGITTNLSGANLSGAYLIIYDLTYQKGLRPSTDSAPRDLPQIIYDLTYQKGLRQYNIRWYFLRQPWIIYDLTYQKGLRRVSRSPLSSSAHSRLSTTWHIKRDYDK